MKRYLLLTLLLSGTFFIGNTALAQGSLFDNCRTDLITEHTDAATGPAAELSRCIRDLYEFGVGAVAILAVGVIMWGGFVWLTSGGNVSRIESAKEWIYGAVFGLVLALSSFLLINTINPQLTIIQLADPPTPGERDDLRKKVRCRITPIPPATGAPVIVNMAVGLAEEDCSGLKTSRQTAERVEDIDAENTCTPTRDSCIDGQNGTIVDRSRCSPLCVHGETCCNLLIRRRR